jgi:hypothetical protein
MNSAIATRTAEQLITEYLGVTDADLVSAIVSIMRDEVFMCTLDDFDPVIFGMGAEQARAIVYGRMARPYVAMEFHQSEHRVLRSDGTFAQAPVRPARYPSESAALLAAERASNRLAGSMVSAVIRPYLPIA